MVPGSSRVCAYICLQMGELGNVHSTSGLRGSAYIRKICIPSSGYISVLNQRCVSSVATSVLMLFLYNL